MTGNRRRLPRRVLMAAIGTVVAIAVVSGAAAYATHPRFGEGTKAVIFGDSWTRGYAAEPIESGYAYGVAETFGWDATVDGSDGTGYVNRGQQDVGSFSERLSAIPTDESVELVLLQGGINDIASTQNLQLAPMAIRNAIHEVRVTYPNARIIILGPAPSELPYGNRLSDMDAYLREAAKVAGIGYISPLQGDWINEGNYAEVINEDAADHPSTAGHQYLSEKVVASLRNVIGHWI